jgi:hypothetical protein
VATKVAEDHLTRREAAELAKVHLNTVRLWESTGRVDTIKAANGVVMIPRSQILEIIESRRGSGMDDSARIAALEAENRMLREERDKITNQYQRILDRFIELAGTRITEDES